jgi:hypothetical protein
MSYQPETDRVDVPNYSQERFRASRKKQASGLSEPGRKADC